MAAAAVRSVRRRVDFGKTDRSALDLAMNGSEMRTAKVVVA
jgi:hypothetical protein